VCFVLCLFCLFTCVCVCLQDQGPLLECLRAGRFRASLLLHTTCVRSWCNWRASCVAAKQPKKQRHETRSVFFWCYELMYAFAKQKLSRSSFSGDPKLDRYVLPTYWYVAAFAPTTHLLLQNLHFCIQPTYLTSYAPLLSEPTYQKTTNIPT